MTRLIKCAKLGKECEGLDHPPLPGQIGQRLYESISKEAWQQWVTHQTMLINENHLSMMDPQARAFIMQEMDKFFYGPGSDKPAGYREKK